MPAPFARSDRIQVVPTLPATSAVALPPAGAYSSTYTVAVPDWADSATVFVEYTRGASNGYPYVRTYLGNATDLGLAMKGDGSYDPITGPTPSDGNPLVFNVSLDLKRGVTRVGVAAAEGGVTATPGTWRAYVTFGGGE